MFEVTPGRVVIGVVTGGVVLLIIVVVGVWAFVTWWRPGFDRGDVVGVYVAHYVSGTETLTLREDGTFLQEVLQESDGPEARSGTWTWDTASESVIIPDCMAVNDGRGNIRDDFRTASGCGLSVEKKWWFFGQLLLGDRDSSPLWKIE